VNPIHDVQEHSKRTKAWLMNVEDRDTHHVQQRLSGKFCFTIKWQMMPAHDFLLRSKAVPLMPK